MKKIFFAFRATVTPAGVAKRLSSDDANALSGEVVPAAKRLGRRTLAMDAFGVRVQATQAVACA